MLKHVVHRENVRLDAEGVSEPRGLEMTTQR